MNLLLVSVFIFFTIVSVWGRPEKYTSKFDSINVDEILSNERLLKNYVNCVLEKGPCTPDGAELKKVIPDALETECEKCSDKQKQESRKVLKFLIEKKPGIWKDLEMKYDPTGEYKRKYCARAKEEGINIADHCD